MKYRAIGENHLYMKAYKKGRKIVTENIVVYVLPDYHAKRLKKENPSGQFINRIGLTVTKKIGKAVVRSRVKRVIREGYRLIDKKYGVRKGFLIVIVARDACVSAKSTDIMNELEFAFKKLDMIRN